MGIPVDVYVDLINVLVKHGVKYIGHEENNAMIHALTPCFQPGYQERMQPPKKENPSDDGK